MKSNLKVSIIVQEWDTTANDYVTSTHGPQTFIVQGVGNDSILYAAYASGISIPLSKQDTTTLFAIRFELNDTITQTLTDTLRSYPAQIVLPPSDAEVLDTIYNSNDTIYTVASRTKVQTLNINGQDTIRIDHQNVQKYISLECGCYVSHTIRQAHVTRHAIDSMAILNQQVSSSDETHIQIYYR